MPKRSCPTDSVSPQKHPDLEEAIKTRDVAAVKKRIDGVHEALKRHHKEDARYASGSNFSRSHSKAPSGWPLSPGYDLKLNAKTANHMKSSRFY